MIGYWLGAVSRDAFLREHFQRAPIAQPALGRAIAPLLIGVVAFSLRKASRIGRVLAPMALTTREM